MTAVLTVLLYYYHELHAIHTHNRDHQQPSSTPNIALFPLFTFIFNFDAFEIPTILKETNITAPYR